MKWPGWEHSALLAAVCGLALVVLRRARPTRTTTALIPAAQELGFVAILYSVWRIARKLPLTHEDGAIERARDIVRVQEWLHLPAELSVQQFVLQYDWLARATNAYYAVAHVPGLLAFLVWLFWRHRDHYARWRNVLVVVTAASLFIRFVRVAPPRFLPELGYIDLADLYGMSVYGPRGTGVSDQFAAMPSIHVGWAAIVAFGVLAASPSRWRWLVAMHLPLTVWAVTATGHHWWMDGIVALGLVGVGLVVDSGGRRSASAIRRAAVPGDDLIPVGVGACDRPAGDGPADDGPAGDGPADVTLEPA